MEKIISKNKIVASKIFNIKSVSIDFGKVKGEFELVESNTGNDGVMILALDENQKVFLIEQFQVGPEKRLLILPRGGMEKGKTPEEQALKELQEEIGFTAAKLIKLSEMDVFPGYFKGITHFFLAEGLSESKLKGDEIEEIIVHKFSFETVIKMIMENEITDGRTIAGILMVKEYMKS